MVCLCKAGIFSKSLLYWSLILSLIWLCFFICMWQTHTMDTHFIMTPLNNSNQIAYVPLWDPGFNKFQQESGSFLLGWRTTIHWNVVPAIFQYNHIYQGCWKAVKATILMYCCYPIQGTRSSFLLKVGTDLSRSFKKNLFRIFPPGLENNNTIKCWSSNFPTSLMYMTMLENCRNNISMYCCSPIQEKRSWFLMKFIEARISEYSLPVQQKSG